jgi:hypothetical protein
MDLFITLGFWLAFIVLGAFDVIGLVEGGKSIVAAIKGKTKIWIATIASFLLSYVVAYFIGVLPAAPLFGSLLTTVLFGGTTIFAFVEIIGYNMIVKTGFALFDSATAWARKKISGTDGTAMTGTGSAPSGQ